MNAQDVLTACTVEGNVVKLPEIQLDRGLYLEVKKALNLIGGKWKGGNTAGFVFEADPTDLLAAVAAGEQRNLKQEFQFFETPSDLALRIVDMADICPEHTVLEPSAGRGAIVKAIVERFPAMRVYCYEPMDVCKVALCKIGSAMHINNDFLASSKSFQYDRIVANPPFAKNQDIDHVYAMYERLKPGGIMVSIASPHWMLCSHKKEQGFRDWLDEVGADLTELPRGTFKESGTMCPAMIIKIEKKDEAEKDCMQCGEGFAGAGDYCQKCRTLKCPGCDEKVDRADTIDICGEEMCKDCAAQFCIECGRPKSDPKISTCRECSKVAKVDYQLDLFKDEGRI